MNYNKEYLNGKCFKVREGSTEYKLELLGDSFRVCWDNGGVLYKVTDALMYFKSGEWVLNPHKEFAYEIF